MRNVIKGNMGKWEVVDQIFAAKDWSGRQYVDRSRVGIWGWVSEVLLVFL
jgi:dipeptidyl aminopeptidase/acylaminoacyl peptidase